MPISPTPADRSQASIEDSIYRLESAYLDDTTAGGNIIRGFEGYLKGTAPGSGMAGGSGGGMGGGGGGGGTATRRKGGITDADRIFSRTSAAVSRVSRRFPSGVFFAGGVWRVDGLQDSPVPAHHAAVMPIREGEAHAMANGSRGVTPKIVKKKKVDREDEDEKPAKRGKISYARE
jgi:chromatin modification-related protein EAF6